VLSYQNASTFFQKGLHLDETNLHFKWEASRVTLHASRTLVITPMEKGK
jgi:hypothetical protein